MEHHTSGVVDGTAQVQFAWLLLCHALLRVVTDVLHQTFLKVDKSLKNDPVLMPHGAGGVLCASQGLSWVVEKRAACACLLRPLYEQH